MFPYSERPGTRALTLDAVTVPQEEKHRRAAALIAESERKLSAFQQKAIGAVRPVLWEQPHPGASLMHGFTDNYLRIETPLDEASVGKITPTRIESRIDGDTLGGSIIYE